MQRIDKHHVQPNEDVLALRDSIGFPTSSESGKEQY
jgi:hypothetical protein